ncbi:hypothetical protein BHM03_00017297 [Ensete ventricosum]|nr:hypothetical protein BHM03_00017297 [Ensete ventricosum]
MNLSSSNLGTNLSSMPFLDPDPASPSLNNPNLGNNGEESRTSLEEELEARVSREATARAAKEAIARKTEKTPTFFIYKRSPLSTVAARRTFRCRLSSPHLLDVEGCRQGAEEKKDEATTTRLSLDMPYIFLYL